MAFTEYYCQTTGSNLNAGSTTADAASLTYVSSVGAGWVSTTGVFVVASGNPSSDGVLVGDFASVYVTSGAVNTGFVARVTARDATTITVSLTAKSGTAPTTDSLGATTLKIGGAWKGPNAAVGFPFGTITGTCLDAAGDPVRVNFKSGTNYSITAAMTASGAGPITYQGYTSSAGDGGRATIDGGTSGAAFSLLSVTGANSIVRDMIFQNNGASGSASGFSLGSGSSALAERVVVNNVRGSGFVPGGAQAAFHECEAYACNTAGNADQGGWRIATACLLRRCISHDNTGANNAGFVILSGTSTLIDCIADTNAGFGGFYIDTNGISVVLLGCVAYNSTNSGLLLKASATGLNVLVENCLFISNGAYGVNAGTSITPQLRLINSGFFGNTTAATNIAATVSLLETGTVTLASSPFVDPANGDFRINLAAAKGAGRGTFTQTAASYAGTIGYPDIGSAQHQELVLGPSRSRTV